MSDVHGVNFRSAPLKEAVRKTAGRGPDIKRDFPVYVDLEMIQSAFQLQSAASNVFSRRLHRDRGIRPEKLGRLCGNSSSDFDLAGHDRSLCLFATGEQAFGNQNLVKTQLLRHFVAHSLKELRPQTSMIDVRTASTACASWSVVMHNGGISTITFRIGRVRSPCLRAAIQISAA